MLPSSHLGGVAASSTGLYGSQDSGRRLRPPSIEESRRISHLPHIHQPETLAEWLRAETLDAWVKRLRLEGGGVHTAADQTRPSSLRGRIQTLPELEQRFLYPVQVEAVGNVGWSLKRNHPRSLVQMATGSGKTIFAITSVYRLIRYAGARRVLFLVDGSNLGEQAEKEFQGFRTPDDHRKFTELYTVQRLTSNAIGAASKVVITTIQRLYSMLKGEPDFAAEDEAASRAALGTAGRGHHLRRRRARPPRGRARPDPHRRPDVP